MSANPSIANAVFGHSMTENAIVATIEASPQTTSPPPMLATVPVEVERADTASTPAILIRYATQPEQHHGGHLGDKPADQFSLPCGRWWCGAPRGGKYTDFTPGPKCTWTGAIQVQFVSRGPWVHRHLTAGHCGEPDDINTFHNLAMRGTGSAAAQNLEIVYRRDDSTKIGIENRNSIVRAGDAWGDFMLVSSLSDGRSANNLVMTGLTTYSRVTTIGTVSVGTRVCISAPHISVPRCDTVDDIGFSKTTDGKRVTRLAATRGSYEGQGGDSGAPLYREGAPNVLVGIHQGSARDRLGRNYQVFSRASLIDDSPNMGVIVAAPIGTDGARDFIQNLYFRALNRAPDLGGFRNFRNHLSSCTLQRARDVGWSVLISDEFKNRHPINRGTRGAKIAHAELRLIHAYRSLFGRAVDSSGSRTWMNILIGGIDSGLPESRWWDVLNALINSQEFTNRVFGPTASVDGRVCR